MIRFLLFFSCFLVLSCSQKEKDNSTNDTPVSDKTQKESETEETGLIVNHWVLIDYDVSQFVEKKTIDLEGITNLEAALNSLIGIAFYDLEADGHYQAGNGGDPTSGNWTLEESAKRLVLKQPQKAGKEVKPTEFTILHLKSEQLILSDKDGLKVIFAPSE